MTEEGMGPGELEPAAVGGELPPDAAGEMETAAAAYGELQELNERLQRDLAAAREELESAVQGRNELAATAAEAVAAYGELLRASAPDLIPEMVQGETVEELNASLSVAREAFARAKERAVRELAAAAVPPGGERAGGLDLSALSPTGKIAHALRRVG